MRYWAVLGLGLLACGGEKTKIVYVEVAEGGEAGELGEEAGGGPNQMGGGPRGGTAGAGGSTAGSSGAAGGTAGATAGTAGSAGAWAGGAAGSAGIGGGTSAAGGDAGSAGEGGAGGADELSCDVATHFGTDCTEACGWSETAARSIGDTPEGCASEGLGPNGAGVCCSACYSAPSASTTVFVPPGTCALPVVDDLRFCPSSDWHIIVQPQTCVRIQASASFVTCDGALEVLMKTDSCMVVRNLNADRKTFGVNRSNLRAELVTDVDASCALACP
jgi:hypothetical protein